MTASSFQRNVVRMLVTTLRFSIILSLVAILRKIADSGFISKHDSDQLQSSAMDAEQQPVAPGELIYLPQGDDELKSINLLLIQDSSSSPDTDWTGLVRTLSSSELPTVECVVLASSTGRAVLQVTPRQEADPHTPSFVNQLDLSKFSRILADRLTASNYPTARVKSLLNHPLTSLRDARPESRMKLDRLDPSNGVILFASSSIIIIRSILVFVHNL